MPTQSVIPEDVRSLIEDAEPVPAANITEPPDDTFELASGYLDDQGNWYRYFRVRELTGRDEEALGKTTKVGPLLSEIIQRGLVSVGPHSGPGLADGLLAGDWETVLLAIRAVTFGQKADYRMRCRECKNTYEVTVDIIEDIGKRELPDVKDITFEFTGRHGTVYDVALPLGSTQRKLLQNLDAAVSEQSTLLLNDCVQNIGNRPAMPETVLNMPMADRRELLSEIAKRRPGPRLQEVTTLCPSCGAENDLSISVAALFQ